MGSIADDMINGQICSLCAMFLFPNETVYITDGHNKGRKVVMPPEGGFGVPVVCEDCYEGYND